MSDIQLYRWKITPQAIQNIHLQLYLATTTLRRWWTFFRQRSDKIKCFSSLACEIDARVVVSSRTNVQMPPRAQGTFLLLIMFSPQPAPSPTIQISPGICSPLYSAFAHVHQPECLADGTPQPTRKTFG